MMSNRFKRALFLPLVSGLTVCAKAHLNTRVIPSESVSSSPTLFGAVVLTMRDSIRSYFPTAGDTDQSLSRLSIDPHPLGPTATLSPDMQALTMASLRVYQADSSDIVRTRSAELARMGVDIGDASTMDKCPGILAPTYDTQACPKSPQLIGVVGPTDSLEARAKVPVVIFRGVSKGKTAVVVTYTLERRRVAWILVDQSLPVIVE